LTLGAAELALFGLGFASDPSGYYFERLGERILEPGMYAPHARRFFALRPGYRHSPEHAGPNALGSWPFRGRPLAPAPPDAWRIAVLGDSCVFGLPLAAGHSLPEALERELAARLGDERALVANCGVPGYSSVQIAALLEELLAGDARPDEVVLYPAAWNDSAPAAGKTDVELARETAGWRGFLRRSALAGALRALSRTGAEQEAASETRPARVPAEEVEALVRGMVQACKRAGIGVTLVAPPHPERFRASHARMFEDAESVRRAGRAEGAALIDLQATLGEPALEERFFADLVHPAPEGHLALAAALAEELAGRAPARERAAPGALAIRAFEPRSAPELGDVELRIEFLGLSDADPLPAITVGGAALLDVRRAGPQVLQGSLPRLAAGAARLVASTAHGIAVAPEPLTVLAPSVTVLPGAPPRVRVVSRPGDRARVGFATRRLEPSRWSSHGAEHLDPTSLLPAALTLELGPDGGAEAELPEAVGTGPVYLQALILPAGEPWDSPFALWSAPAALP
jgi:lysophospholipase L1-like esterase